MDVAFADNAKVSDDIYGRSAEHVVIVIGKRLRGGHNDGITRVNSQRIKVLESSE